MKISFSSGNDGQGWRVLERTQPWGRSEPQVFILAGSPKEAENLGVLLGYAPDLLRLVRDWADRDPECNESDEARAILRDCEGLEV